MTTVSNCGARASIASSDDLPTPEPANTPMRCPRQSGVKRSTTRTPVRIGVETRARRKRRRRIGVERRGPVAVGEFARAVERAAKRVDDAALPRRVRRQREGFGAIGARADGGVAARVEGLQRRGGVVDLDDLADLHAVADIDADAFAQA